MEDLRFSLRSLFLFTTITAVLLGTATYLRVWQYGYGVGAVVGRESLLDKRGFCPNIAAVSLPFATLPH
jgi:hypothetical protein